VTEQDLDSAKIDTVFEKMCSEGMPQGVIVVLIISFPLRSAIVITRATQQKSNLFAI
jgi:hypothetical protein